MEYVRYFEEHSAHQVFLDNDLFGEPTLSYCGEERDVVCRPYREKPYLKFTAQENNCSVKLNKENIATFSQTLQYSLDEGTTWSAYTFTKKQL